MFLSRSTKYFPIYLEKDGGRESSEDDDSQTRDLLRDSNQLDSTRINPNIIMGITVLCLVALGFVGAFFLGTKWRPDLDRVCLEHTSMWSPVLQEMDAKYHLVQFNGTLGHKSEYCGEPTPELDAVWEKWAYVKYASIPEKTFAKLGEETDAKLGVSMDMESAQLTPEYGGGYIGFLEVSHHIHCLNLLRKGVHRDYYMQPEHMPIEFKDPPWVLKLHLAHCIEILRENIMCNADVGVIPHEWVKGIPDPFANFNTWHKCRDISSVEKWIHANEIPDAPNGAELPIPIGSKIYSRPP